jgi:hypothetical protein
MTDTDKKLNIIENKLAIQLKKSKSSFRNTIIIYLLIIIFVIVYSTYVTSRFKDLATPDTVAELLMFKTEEALPIINQYLLENSQPLADSFATQTVDYTRAMIPSLGLLVQGQLDLFAAQINNEFNTKYLPVIDEYFKENKDSIVQNINTLSDEQSAELLAKALMEQVDFGVLNISNEFNTAMIKFKQQVNYLAYTRNSKLTKKELAHKRAIAYWMYLVKHAKTGKLEF